MCPNIDSRESSKCSAWVSRDHHGGEGVDSLVQSQWKISMEASTCFRFTNLTALEAPRSDVVVYDDFYRASKTLLHSVLVRSVVLGTTGIKRYSLLVEELCPRDQVQIAAKTADLCF